MRNKFSKQLNRCCSKKLFFFIVHFTLVSIPKMVVFDLQIAPSTQKGLDSKRQFLILSSAYFLSTIVRFISGYLADAFGHRNIPYMLAFASFIALILLVISSVVALEHFDSHTGRHFKWKNDYLEEINKSNNSKQVIPIKYKIKKPKIQNIAELVKIFT